MRHTFARRFLAAATLVAVLVLSCPPTAAAAGWGSRAERGFFAQVWDWFVHLGSRTPASSNRAGLTSTNGDQGSYIDPNGDRVSPLASAHP